MAVVNNEVIRNLRGDCKTWTCVPLLEPRYLPRCPGGMRSDHMPEIESTDGQRQIAYGTWRRIEPVDTTFACLNRQIAVPGAA